MISIGTDIVEIKRMKTFSIRKRFIGHVLSISEQEYIKSFEGKVEDLSKKYATVAGLFAAKEAVLKALKIGFSKGLDIYQIEIAHDALGAPYVILSGIYKEIFEKMGGKEIAISTTDDAGIAFAVCVITG